MRWSAIADALERPEHQVRALAHLRGHLREPPVIDAGYSSDPYPIDPDGFARSFDPVAEPELLRAAWHRHGFVVARAVVDEAVAEEVVALVDETMRRLSGGACSLTGGWERMPADPAGTPILTRGFFEVYHHPVLARMRQSPRMYLHHVLLWQQVDLWTAFDRLGVKLPDHPESVGLPAHVDQNPLVHPGLRTTQGILALRDCPVEIGVTTLVPGSRAAFAGYERLAGRGEYVELTDAHPQAADLRERLQEIPLRACDIVTWDSRTTHANTPNTSSVPRLVAVQSAGPARDDDPALLRARLQALETCEGLNVRDALMHASKRSRYTHPEALRVVHPPETFTPLGRLLYGLDRWNEGAGAGGNAGAGGDGGSGDDGLPVR